jgi:hypothetical protein
VQRSSERRGTSYSKAVFINVPFDSSYERLFVTLIGTLVFLGQEPHCVLEVREKGDGRLLRIMELMRTCRMSIHDLSRTGTPVRFKCLSSLGSHVLSSCRIQAHMKSSSSIRILTGSTRL